MANYYLADYMRDFKALGEATFAAQNRFAHLVGQGIAGDIAQKDNERTSAVNKKALEERGLWLDRVFALKPKTGAGPLELVVGRSPEADILIPDHTISRRHCAFQVSPGSFSITDLGGANGTLVKKLKVGKQRMPLTGGEEIVLGRLVFVFLTPEGFLSLVRSGVVRRNW